YTGDLGLVPKPAQRPLGRAPAPLTLAKQAAGPFGQQVDQFAAAQRFHNDDREPSGGGSLQSGPSGLTVLVHIIVLDLAEIPIIAIQQLHEHPGSAVKTEP